MKGTNTMYLIHHFDGDYDARADKLCEEAFTALVAYHKALREYYDYVSADCFILEDALRERVETAKAAYADARFQCAYWLHGHWPLKREHPYPRLTCEEIEEHEREDFFKKYDYYPKKIF